MILRPLISNTCRRGLAGLICLACVCFLRAGDVPTRPIDVVPVHNGSISTNINEAESATAGKFDKVLPGAVHPFNLEDAMQGAPTPYMPPQTHVLTQREQEWIDRRKNWVFMSPEELMSDTAAEKLLGIKDSGKDAETKEVTTAMQRYYMRLSNSDHPGATNQFTELDSESRDKTNDWISLTAPGDDKDRNFDGTTRTFESPFNSPSDQAVFKPERAESIPDVFNLNPDPKSQTDDELRVKKEQEAHIEAFKQIWNMDQPATSPAAAVTASDSTSVANSLSGAQPIFGAASPAVTASSLQQNPAPAQPTMSSERSLLMQRPNFTAPHFNQ